MAVIYFTSNASTGAGSLVEAIANAQPGDVIRPDESVFERGSTIEIALASTLTIGKALTFNGSPYRVRLNGGGSTACANITDGATVEFVGFDFVGSSGAAVTTTGNVTFDRCRIAGANGDGVAADDNAVTLKNSIVCGNNGAPVVAGSAVIDGSTIIGNVDALEVVDVIVNNSIVPGSPSVAPSQIGFVVAPPDNFGGGNWTANAWQNWDLRLFDDASPTPSSYRDSGDVGAMSRYDFDGNFRGRETNGVATCSPGAYETIQADLFWVGEPFPQEMVDAAPQNIRIANYRQTTGSTLLEADMTWEIPDGVSYSSILGQYSSDGGLKWSNIAPVAANATSRKATQITPGKKYQVRLRGVFADGSYTAWSIITYASPLELDGSNGKQSWEIQLPSPLSVVNPSFLTSDGWATSRFATAFDVVAPTTGAALFVGETVSFDDAPPFAVALVVGADNVVIHRVTSAYLTIGATRSAAVGGSLAALRLGDYSELMPSTSLDIPAVEFGGANIVIDNVSVEINDGVIFAAEPRPAAITTTGSGGWADTTVGVSSLDVDSIDAQTVAVSIVKNDVNKAAFAQYSTDDGATWQTVATTADVDEYSLTVPQGADVTVRVATATGWLSDTVSTAPFLPVWTVAAPSESVIGVVNAFEISTGGSNTGNNSYNLSGWGNL